MLLGDFLLLVWRNQLTWTFVCIFNFIELLLDFLEWNAKVLNWILLVFLYDLLNLLKVNLIIEKFVVCLHVVKNNGVLKIQARENLNCFINSILKLQVIAELKSLLVTKSGLVEQEMKEF